MQCNAARSYATRCDAGGYEATQEERTLPTRTLRQGPRPRHTVAAEHALVRERSVARGVKLPLYHRGERWELVLREQHGRGDHPRLDVAHHRLSDVGLDAVEVERIVYELERGADCVTPCVVWFA